MRSYLSFDEASRRIRAALGRAEPRALDADDFRPAAVLLPMLRRPLGPTFLFTRRTEEMAQHKGQISFPGGQVEPGEDAVTAALREAREEVGLRPDLVDVAGRLDEVPSVTRYRVTPVVGLVADPPRVFRPQAAEVLEPFEVPLSQLMDRRRMRVETWDESRLPEESREDLFSAESGLELFDPETRTYKVYFFDAGGRPQRVIWGLTARILKALLEKAFAVTVDRD